MIDWMEILKRAVADQASDVFFVAGKSPCEKVEGHIRPLSDQRLMPADTEQVISEIYQAAGRSMEAYLQRGDDDYSFSLPSLARFRVNTYRQRGSLAAEILLGEMRDAETIHTAISAAETGHVVIATLHTRGAVNAIDRIIDAFPSNQQTQIRVQLSSVLRTVVSQQLL